MPLWTGRFQKELDQKTNDFNSSISFDCKMARQDIEGSIAHATMLGQCGVIDKSEADAICQGLEGILKDLQSGTLEIDMTQEDIHTFMEGELTRRLGDTGKRLHTARSRNDQVALDIRLYLREEAQGLLEQIKELTETICVQAEAFAGTVMPGYTHLQRAQPITFGHHLMAYAEMFLRDLGRLQDAVKRMNVNPLGSGALASTTYPIDRTVTTRLLGFIFDSVETVKMCLTAFTPMLATMKVLPENMRKAAAGGFINATDCADYLVKKGLPFRDAYKATGTLVARCIELGETLETLPMEEYQTVCEAFDEGVYEAISLENCVNGRSVLGGPARESVLAQVKRVRGLLREDAASES